MAIAAVDRSALESKVKSMYSDVAANPHGECHFEMGRAMAERLGYAPQDLDRIPADAIDSLAGVGHFFHLANLRAGERVVDLGSGSGMDSFIAALKVGPTGAVVGVDMTDAQLAKATRLAETRGAQSVSFRKASVFEEAARLLKAGGRLAIADIVTEQPLPENVVCNADLWAACIGGAAQQSDYRSAIEAAGLTIEHVEDNSEYRFISDRARKATAKWGVESVSIVARKS